MKKIILIIITGFVLFVASISAAMVVNNKIKSTKYDLVVRNSAGGSVVIDIDGETTNVESGTNKTISVKRKTKVKLSATADQKYNFAGWKIGSASESSNEITITISSKTEVKTKYESKAVNLTVDGETVSYGIANNLLEFLKNTFPAETGYTKEYFIGTTKVTESTEIWEATQITTKQTAITYYVTFMHNNQQVGEKVAYTVENKNVIAPSLPSEAGYNITWPNITSSLNELKNFTVYSIKTPIQYTATFKHNNTVVAEIKYDITTKDNVVAPAVPSVEAGYEAKWEDYTLGLSNTTINLIVSEIEYTVTFIHNNQRVGEPQTYTINDRNISIPAVPVEAGYTIVWETFSLEDKTENIVVKTIKTPITYTVTFKHNGTTIATREYTVENRTIENPAAPVKAGYTIVWETFSLEGKAENIVVNSNTSTIYYTVTFKHNDTIVATREYTVENRTIENPAVPVEDGYTIVWETFSLEDKTENIVVKTVKTPITYTVTFKHNGTPVATREYTVENRTIENPAVPAASDRYTYAWPTINLTNKLENIEVDSEPTPINFTINYTQASNMNQLTGLTASEITALNNVTTYNCETPTFTLKNPTRVGYTFTGWSLNNAGETKELNVTIEFGSIGDKRYTAHWEKNSATVRLGELENVKAIYYGTSASKIDTKLTKDGFNAKSDETYYFMAELDVQEYYTTTFVSFTGWFADIVNPSNGHSVVADQVYTLGAKATKNETKYASCTFTYSGDLYESNGFEDVDLVLLAEVVRKGANFYYISGYDNQEHSISIEEFANAYFNAVTGAYIAKINDTVITDMNNDNLVDATDFKLTLLQLTATTEELTINFVFDQIIII